MGPPPVQYNTYVQSPATPYVDSISKFYLISELMFGVNRLPVFGNVNFIFVLSGLAYSALLQILTVYGSWKNEKLSELVEIINVMQYLFNAWFSFTSCKRMHLYYNELNKFDLEVGCKPCIPNGSIKNVFVSMMTVVPMLFLFFMPYQIPELTQFGISRIPKHFINLMEVYYFGHLLNLLTARLRLINYFMELSLPNIKDTPEPSNDEFIFLKKDILHSNGEMKKIMDVYHTVIKAYDLLMEAIKWQLLSNIVDGFITVLGLSYFGSYKAIRNQYQLTNCVSDFGLSFIILLPLFSPCVFGNQVNNEVRRLRKLLASRLYENKLDKSSRSITRALLAFTETKDLSFYLLRMLSIDISLPFKFVGLVVTYLIILLQFEKVINP